MLPQLLLASRSPRRRVLLEQVGVRFETVDAEVDETTRPGEAPEDLACRLALAKATLGFTRDNTHQIPALGADTLVVLDREVLGKPVTPAATENMLRRLSGRTHYVLSAVAIVCGAQHRVLLSQSQVTFRKLSDAELAMYVATGEGADKAGGYAIQGLAALFVQRLEGSYSGVMGLPLYECAQLLADFGCQPPWLDNGDIPPNPPKECPDQKTARSA